MKKTLLPLLVSSLLLVSCNSANVGVIGGADGPTSIYVKAGTFGEEFVKRDIKMFFANGNLYYDTGAVSVSPKTCGTPDGKLTESVKENEIPKREGEANFSADGFFDVDEESKEVVIEEERRIFKKYKNLPANLEDYTYCCYIKGRLKNAEKDSETVVLSDKRDVDFDSVYKYFLSSAKSDMLISVDYIS